MGLADRIKKLDYYGLAKRALIVGSVVALAAVSCDGKEVVTYPQEVTEDISDRYERCARDPNAEGCDPEDFISDFGASKVCKTNESEEECRERLEKILEDIFSEEPPITGYVVKDTPTPKTPTQTPVPTPRPKKCWEVIELFTPIPISPKGDVYHGIETRDPSWAGPDLEWDTLFKWDYPGEGYPDHYDLDIWAPSGEGMCFNYYQDGSIKTGYCHVRHSSPVYTKDHQTSLNVHFKVPINERGKWTWRVHASCKTGDDGPDSAEGWFLVE